MTKKKLAMMVLSAMLILGMALVFTACGSQEAADTAETTEAAVSDTAADDAGEADQDPISDDSIDMDGCLVTINTKGMGQVARAEEGRTIVFDDDFPTQSTADNLKEGTKLVIQAKADDGWKFKKWTLNGKKYSSDEQIEYTVTEDAAFVAVFKFDE